MGVGRSPLLAGGRSLPSLPPPTVEGKREGDWGRERGQCPGMEMEWIAWPVSTDDGPEARPQRRKQNPPRLAIVPLLRGICMGTWAAVLTACIIHCDPRATASKRSISQSFLSINPLALVFNPLPLLSVGGA